MLFRFIENETTTYLYILFSTLSKLIQKIIINIVKTITSKLSLQLHKVYNVYIIRTIYQTERDEDEQTFDGVHFSFWST